MPIQRNYRGIGEGNIASYNWTDIAEGTGNVNFYLAVTAKSGPTYSYELTSDTSFNSFGVRLTGGYTGNVITFPNNATTNFDFNLTPFSLPKTVNGTALVNLFYHIFNTIATLQNLYTTLTIYKVSGGDVTSIGTAVSNTVFGSSALDDGVGVISVPITISNKVVFKRGDYIRLRVAGTVANVAGAPQVHVGTDPGNSEYVKGGKTAFRTNSFIRIPFKIDL